MGAGITWREWSAYYLMMMHWLSVCLCGVLGTTYQSMAQVIATVESGSFKQVQDPVINQASFYHDQQQPYWQHYKLAVKPPPLTHHAMWMNSGKFQGDIDGVTVETMRQAQDPNRFHNGLRNEKLMWTDGIIAYELDERFTTEDRAILERAFSAYRRRTCVQFVPRVTHHDYLYIAKNYGCYSQVGRTGGRQEISLGPGCLFHEIIVHELMHTVGFWHEHSRADRDNHINIQWDNILPGMKGQFDKISSAFQDLLGESYDYRSVMHYDSTAFSANGQNTIVTVQDGFTNVIGAALDLSDIDVRKINKLYKCSNTKSGTATPAPSRPNRKVIDVHPNLEIVETKIISVTQPPKVTIFGRTIAPTKPALPTASCRDQFLDCPFFYQYCERSSFYFVMKSYCPFTCRHCEDSGELESSFVLFKGRR